MSHDFYAIVHGDREALFRDVFGTNRVPIKSIDLELVMLPGFDRPQPVYQLALDQVTFEQRRRMVRHIAQKFGYSEQDVDERLEAEGVPILARDAGIAVFNPQRWLG